MSKLTETQILILSRASQQDDRIAMPLPDRLRGGAANKVIVPLIKHGLLDEVEADIRKNEPTWRKTGDGHGTTLIITDAGIKALGIEADSAPQSPDVADETTSAATNTEAAKDAPVCSAPRAGTKLAMLVDMLRAEGGATCDELAAALEWRRHTVRGALAGAVRKRLGLNVIARVIDGRGRVYSIE